jgi:outer membrane lipoprotein-sorting protein
MNYSKRASRNREILIPLCLCVIFILSVILAGCAKKETDPVKALIAESVKALGGAKRTTAWKTRAETGLFQTTWPGWGNLSAACTRLVKKPDKLKIDRDFSAYDHPFFQTYFYNGGDAWMIINLNTRQYPTLASNLEDYLETVDGLPYYYAACDSFFLETEIPDDSLYAGATLDRVGLVHDGDTILYDLGKENHLPARIIENGGSRHTVLDDYRKVNGMQVPFHITVFENGMKQAEYTWEEIQFNKKIEDSLFEEGRPAPPDTSSG